MRIAVVLLAACGFEVTAPSKMATDDALGTEMPADANVDAPSLATVLYAGPINQLYTISQDDLSATLVGDFKVGGSNIQMEDIAVDLQGVLVGIDTAFASLYQIDTATGACTKLADLPAGHGHTFRGLAFGYPAGVETLYGGTGQGRLIEVNRATGALRDIGAFGNGLVTGGDIAWIPGIGIVVGGVQAGNPRYATVDVATGSASIIGNTPTAMLGLGVIGTKLYGFGANDLTYELSPANGSMTRSLTTSINWAHGAP